MKEYITAHSTDEHLIADLKTKDASQIVQESFKMQSASNECTESNLNMSTRQTIGVMLDEEIYNFKNTAETHEETSPLDSTKEKCNVENAFTKITESKDKHLITEKPMNKKSEEVSPDNKFSDLSLKSTYLQINKSQSPNYNLDFVSQTVKGNNMLMCTILKVPNTYAFEKKKACSQESTDNFYQNIEIGEMFNGKTHCHENKAVSTKENSNSAVNIGRQMIDSIVESSSIKPTLHSIHGNYEKVKHETERIQKRCSPVPAKNTDSDPEITYLLSDNNAYSEQKLESNSNIQPMEVVLKKELSNNLKHTNIVADSNIISNQLAVRSDKEIGLASQEITKNEKANVEMSSRKVIPPEFLSFYENALPLLPADISSDISDNILNEIFQNNTDLSELMEIKFIIDNQLKKEILQHYNTFVESSKDKN